MSESKPTRQLVLGGAWVLTQSQILGTVSNTGKLLSDIDNQVGVIASKVLDGLASLANTLGDTVSKLEATITQLSSMGNQLSGLLSQLASLQREWLRKRYMIYINNTTDQVVRVARVLNVSPSLDNPLDTDEVYVNANSTFLTQRLPERWTWAPYIIPRVQCAKSMWDPTPCTTPPTKGSVTVLLVRLDGTIETLVDNLELRDTNPHDPFTDPGKIRWTTW